MNSGDESRVNSDTGSQDEDYVLGHDEDDELVEENLQNILNPLENALIEQEAKAIAEAK